MDFVPIASELSNSRMFTLGLGFVCLGILQLTAPQLVSPFVVLASGLLASFGRTLQAAQS